MVFRRLEAGVEDLVNASLSELLLVVHGTVEEVVVAVVFIAVLYSRFDLPLGVFINW